jgi:uncharacterized protein (DUF302 family)
MLITMETTKSVEDAGRDLEAAAVRHRFGVMGVHNLREAMRSKGVDFAGTCLVYEVCNPHQAKKVLEAHPEISTALPCRISVYKEGGKVKLCTIRPSILVKQYNAPDLDEVAADVEDVLTAIMREAAALR